MEFHIDLSQETPEALARLKTILTDYIAMVDDLRDIDAAWRLLDPTHKSQIDEEQDYYEAVARLLCSEEFKGTAVAVKRRQSRSRSRSRLIA
jgi:hypothetical protein